jgi:hypothetical protein
LLDEVFVESKISLTYIKSLFIQFSKTIGFTAFLQNRVFYRSWQMGKSIRYTRKTFHETIIQFFFHIWKKTNWKYLDVYILKIRELW